MDKVTQIILDRILSLAKSDNVLFWERPQYFYNSFNYYTRRPYRGINRWLLPFGEYMTFKQFNELNKSLGNRYHIDTDNAVYQIVFFKKEVENPISPDEVPDEVKDMLQSSPNEVVFQGYTKYYIRDNVYYRAYSFRRYTTVVERQYCIDDNGEPLPSKVGTEVEITMENPYKVIESYIGKNNIKLEHPITNEPAYYSTRRDLISVPNIRIYKSEGYYISSHFHEMAHSTGTKDRLNRPSLINYNEDRSKFEEELIAEITASMLCAETGVLDIETSNMREFENHSAYIQSYLQALSSKEYDLISICNKAEKAFDYILSYLE